VDFLEGKVSSARCFLHSTTTFRASTLYLSVVVFSLPLHIRTISVGLAASRVSYQILPLRPSKTDTRNISTFKGIAASVGVLSFCIRAKIFIPLRYPLSARNLSFRRLLSKSRHIETSNGALEGLAFSRSPPSINQQEHVSLGNHTPKRCFRFA
jgi:hypothetical protein